MKPHPKEDTVTSPNSKKSKVKLPDFEKTLANWVRNQREKGTFITDEELRKQAVMFSAGRTDQHTLSSVGWLEKFKQKHLEGNATDLHNDTTNETSPVSSNGLASPPMSAVEEHAPGTLRPVQQDHAFDFSAHDVFESNSIHQSITADMNPSQGSLLSPASPDLSRDEGNSVAISDDGYVGDFDISARQRSQTFPHLPEATALSTPPLAHRNAPTPVRSMTTSINTNLRETAIDPRQMMKRHKSVPDIHDTEMVRYSTMQPPPLPRSVDMSPISNPSSPASDDHIRALHMIKQLFEQRPDVAEPDDYVMIGKLMEKLKILRNNQSSMTPTLPAGMHAMDISESPRLSRKRTILGISN